VVDLARLQKLGFTHIVDWGVRGGRPAVLDWSWEDKAGSLYAFVVGDDVRYLGQTTTVLRSRLGLYASSTASQNARLRALIALEQSAGHPVQVYWKALGPSVDLNEVERQFINEFRPAWNRT